MFHLGQNNRKVQELLFLTAAFTVKMKVVNLLKEMFKKRVDWFCSFVSDYLARTQRLIPMENFKTENEFMWPLYYYKSPHDLF